MKVMSNDNPAMSDSVHDFIVERLNLAGFSFDSDHHLITADGNIEYYFPNPNSVASNTVASELFPFLVGIDPTKEKEFSYIEMPNGVIVDVFIKPTNVGYDVVLIDMALQRDKHQQVQQIANVVSLQKDEISAENEAKSKFISTFSHELKTPLSSILGYSELLTEQTKESTMVTSNANAIHRNGIYLLNLINNVLEQGKADIQQTTITTSPVKLSDMLDSVSYLVKPLAEKKKISFSIHYGCPEDFVLVLDEQHLCQVLVNLVTNSIKFSQEGFIVIEVNYADNELQFVVSDTGIGIPEDELATIMQPYGRAKHTQHIEGAGIGLSLSNTLVTLMGGELTIQSKLGEGTAVTVNVPTTNAVIASELSGDVQNSTNKQILLAEDDEDLVPLIAYYLEEAGYDVITALSQDELRSVLKDNQPDIILMDHNFREANGIELTKELLESGFDGKIIMLTASSGEAIVKQAMGAGCVDFITKPLDRDKLRNILAEHIND